MKNIFIGAGLVFVGSLAVQSFFLPTTSELEELNRRTVDAETALAEASVGLAEVSARHTSLVDSVKQESDSLRVVVAQAKVRSDNASRSYSERTSRLVDSLNTAGQQIISEQVLLLKQAHDSVVVALNDEIDALNADRALLWRRIEVSDSVIGAQSMQIQASEAVMAALRNERDAWRVKANPSLPKRLMGQAPALLAGAVLVSLIR
jgi:chromosome segregation ATPase